MFDRETRKEKNLEMARKLAERGAKPKEGGARRTDENMETILKDIETEFDK